MSETTNGIVIDYKDLTHSNYPRQEDKLMDFHDPSDEEAKWIKEYNSYMASGRVADATDVLVRHPSLRKCIINADILLSLHHSIIAVQRYVYDNVLDKIVRLGNQKGDWNEQMSSDATDESLRLNKYDVIDSVYYLNIANLINNEKELEELRNKYNLMYTPSFVEFSEGQLKTKVEWTPENGIIKEEVESWIKKIEK